MNVLITGGAGFIGSHIVDAYIAEEHNVVIVDNLSGGVLENINPKAKFYQLDVRSEKLEDVFQKEKIDVVNHLAAQMDVRRSVDDPKFDASVNVLGGLNLFESARKHRVKKIIFRPMKHIPCVRFLRTALQNSVPRNTCSSTRQFMESITSFCAMPTCMGRDRTHMVKLVLWPFSAIKC